MKCSEFSKPFTLSKLASLGRIRPNGRSGNVRLPVGSRFLFVYIEFTCDLGIELFDHMLLSTLHQELFAGLCHEKILADWFFFGLAIGE